MRRTFIFLALAAIALGTTGCDSDDAVTETPTERLLITIKNVGPASPVLKSGVFDTPVGAVAPAPIAPGEAYEVDFTAGPGMRLSFATMFIQSNDIFYAFPGEGLALYDANGTARTGDVTAELGFYDAGTEVNEAPGTGPNQAPRQSSPGAGTDENGVVQRVADVNDGFTYPALSEVIKVTLTHDGDTEFTFRIENVGDGVMVNEQPIPLSPGSWAVHNDDITFFERGAAASAGLESIAEDGDPSASLAELTPMTGLTVPLSPGAYIVHTDEVRFFQSGTAASEPFERIAEDGNPAELITGLPSVSGILSSGVFDTPAGESSPAPIAPGGSYSFEIDAREGDRLSFATMFIQSNDLFYTFPGNGLALFNAVGSAVTGDVTDQVRLYDAGTEVDEEPGVGLNQAPRQSGPDTGDDEDGVLTQIEGTDDGFTYPDPADIIQVTISQVQS